MSCYKYWEKISAIADSLSKYEHTDLKSRPLDEIIPLLDAIEVIAHDKTIGFNEAKHILYNEKMNEALKIIRGFYVEVGTNLEVHNALDVLEAEEPWVKLESFHFYDRYVILVRDEGRLANFTSGDKAVFIGGGPLPLTLMLLNAFYGVKGISIEIVPRMAELSKRAIDKLGFGSEIEVVCGNETTLSHLQYDAVMVAALAEPKKRIFSNIRRLVSLETKILYRTYSGMRAILYAPVTTEDLVGFQELDRVLPVGKVNNTSVLIRKELE
jgi:hypothetical protein